MNKVAFLNMMIWAVTVCGAKLETSHFCPSVDTALHSCCIAGRKMAGSMVLARMHIGLPVFWAGTDPSHILGARLGGSAQHVCFFEQE